jgi:lipopolysaccharide transport system ATP-binding protein
MSVIIEVRDLGKQYRLGTRSERLDSFRDVLQHMIRNPLQHWLRSRDGDGKANGTGSIWALRNVNFDVTDGETLGIIGANGAGKSTLLKILSQITEPTCGVARIRGRLSSLLEVGTGFHPELTGRENIFLNGAILGMRKAEICSKFDEIVAFAELDDFLDTPVKRYSSGMYVRLAFAVAASLSPEILVVDEVLAVGDLAFQRKCLGKMSDIGKGGRTVLFVSHNMAAIENMCKRCIWISRGRIRQDGDTKDVIRAYLDSLTIADQLVPALSALPDRSGTGAVRFLKMEFLDRAGNELRAVHSGDALRVRLHYECYRDVPRLNFGFRILTNFGVLLTDANTWSTGQAIPLAPKGRGCIDLEIDFLNLMPGTYTLGIWASSSGAEGHDLIDNVGKLEVEPSDIYGTGRGIEARFGVILFKFRWLIPEDSNSGNRMASRSAAPSTMPRDMRQNSVSG